MSATPSEVGERAEGAVLAALLRAGYRVLMPFGGSCRYDLVFEDERGFQRVQVKHATLKRGCIRFRAYSSTGKGTAKIVRAYKGEADYFGVFCTDTGDVLLVPVDDVPGSEVCLRVDPAANGQAKGLRWAEQYRVAVV